MRKLLILCILLCAVLLLPSVGGLAVAEQPMPRWQYATAEQLAADLRDDELVSAAIGLQAMLDAEVVDNEAIHTASEQFYDRYPHIPNHYDVVRAHAVFSKCLPVPSEEYTSVAVGTGITQGSQAKRVSLHYTMAEDGCSITFDNMPPTDLADADGYRDVRHITTAWGEGMLAYYVEQAGFLNSCIGEQRTVVFAGTYVDFGIHIRLGQMTPDEAEAYLGSLQIENLMLA